MADWRLETGGEGSFGEREDILRGGEPLLELGGVTHVPPRRIWQVGHIFTKRDISSLGTLWGGQVSRVFKFHLFSVARCRINSSCNQSRTMSIFAGLGQKFYPDLHVDIVGVPL